jgi:hypothetical protein
MSRSASLSLAALALLIARPGYSETGDREARAAARVSVSIPSVHGADVPSRPAESGRAVFAASRPPQSPRLELPALRVMSSNGDASIQLVRRVRDTGAVTVASSPRRRSQTREDVSTASRSGATGWTELHDELEIPAVAAASRGARRVTVIYEVWSF